MEKQNYIITYANKESIFPSNWKDLRFFCKSNSPLPGWDSSWCDDGCKVEWGK